MGYKNQNLLRWPDFPLCSKYRSNTDLDIIREYGPCFIVVYRVCSLVNRMWIFLKFWDPSSVDGDMDAKGFFKLRQSSEKPTSG